VRLLVHWRDEGGIRLPVACWQPGPGYRMISSGVLGGGIGPREWVLNAQVPGQYARTDPAGHLTELADRLGLTGPGTGMLTAAQVTNLVIRSDEGAEAAVTAGLRVPTWAAAPVGAADPDPGLGTINIIVSVPVPLTDAALVNAVVTATEAKTQAVLDAGFPGTGTATDAVCVAAPASPETAEDFAGPRSAWGARIARAVYAAMLAGATAYRAGQLPAIAHLEGCEAAIPAASAAGDPQISATGGTNVAGFLGGLGPASVRGEFGWLRPRPRDQVGQRGMASPGQGGE
jgi:adenosylcobinamide amidohydrolase